MHTMLECAHPAELARTGVCETRIGEERYHLANGETLYGHGGDPVSDEPAALGSTVFTAQSYVTPTAANLDCVPYSPTGGHYFQLVYVYPAGGTIRTAAENAVVTQFEEASAFVNQQAAAETGGAASSKLVTACDGGVPHITAVAVANPTDTDVDDIYRDVTGELAAQGYDDDYVHYVFYWDVADGGNVAGIGDVFRDSSAGTGNANVSQPGARYAMTFNTDSSSPASGMPYWQYMLHEASHTMGAVQPAPSHPSSDTTAGDHCIDGPDIMCYADGSLTSAQLSAYAADQTKCSSSAYDIDGTRASRYDCNGDAYFNPQPVAGSWLSGHWNLAMAANVYLQTVLPPDTSAPTTPTSVTGASGSDGAIHLTWTAAQDDRGVASYRIYRSSGGGFTQVGTSTGTTYVDGAAPATGASVQYQVDALDATGNASSKSATATVIATDLSAPSAPTAVAVTGNTANSITVSWAASTDNVGVTGYRVKMQATGAGYVIAATTPGLSATVGGLQALTSYELQVTAVDAAGNESTSAPGGFPGYLVGATSAAVSVAVPTPANATLSSPTTTTPGTPAAAPKAGAAAAPARPRVRAIVGRRSVRVLWKSVVGAQRYVILRGTGSGPMRRIGISKTPAYVDRSAHAKTRYRYTVIAVSAAGSSSAPSAPASAAPGS